jgi:hypothetical protein
MLNFGRGKRWVEGGNTAHVILAINGRGFPPGLLLIRSAYGCNNQKMSLLRIQAHTFLIVATTQRAITLKRK